MKLLGLFGTVIEHVPFLGQFLPKDKPWYQSATAQVGAVWGVAEALAPVVSILFPPAAPVCLSVVAALHVAGPALMILGVRKTVIDNTRDNPQVTPPTK